MLYRSLFFVFLIACFQGEYLFAEVSIEESSATLEVSVSGSPVLSYVKEVRQPPEGVDPIYQISGFMHPLRTPKGKVVTDGFPVEFPHQNGVFSAWTMTTFRHRVVDFWNRHLGSGYYEHVSVDETGENFFIVSRQMVSRDRGVAINETWKVSVMDREDVFVVDIEIQQEPATSHEILLHKYKYGGFSFRGSATWNRDDKERFEGPMKILTGLGVTDPVKANHQRAGWVAAYGPIEGETGGVVVMDHPMNFRYPQPARIHNEYPYFVHAPIVEGPVILQPGFIYKARYRMITFDGEPDAESIAEWYADYTGK